MNSIHLGDCLEVMKTIKSGSLDMILCDLPYGTTGCKWDSIISLDLLWKQYKRIIKLHGVVALTASQPFTTELISSNMEMFKYCWVWDKRTAGFLNVKRQPLRVTEDIVIFCLQPPTTYNPQMSVGKPYQIVSRGHKSDIYGQFDEMETINIGEYYPKNLLSFKGVKGRVHPTQKPVALFEYLIRTYTNKGETVLDNCAGSGTTAIACINTGRNYILIEKEEEYVEICKQRIEEKMFPVTYLPQDWLMKGLK